MPNRSYRYPPNRLDEMVIFNKSERLASTVCTLLFLDLQSRPRHPHFRLDRMHTFGKAPAGRYHHQSSSLL